MVPTIKAPKDALRNNGFINGYVKDETSDHVYDGCIYLLFRPENIDKFREFLDNEYERTKDIVEDYDYEGGYVVVVYKLNTLYNKDFELVRKGAYTKTSAKFQLEFPKVIKIIKNGLSKDEVSLQYRIFNRTQDLIEFWEDKLGVKFDDDLEVWDGFQEEKEILNINKIKKNV
tara:strand:- start:506 stop:1024 length:519 start_codon:yes stop_codon:yes gene_type:complete